MLYFPFVAHLLAKVGIVKDCSLRLPDSTCPARDLFLVLIVMQTLYPVFAVLLLQGAPNPKLMPVSDLLAVA
jgi:hypothetical protein